MNRLVELLRNPPGRVFHALCLLVAGVVLWSATTPGGTVAGFLIGLYGIGLLALVWVVRLVLGSDGRRPTDTRFGVAPLMGVLVVVLLATGLPLQARWSVSKHAFEAAAEEGGDVRPGEVERIGAYEVVSIEQVGGGTLFTLSSGGFLDVGFAHLPDGPAPVIEAQRFESPEFVPLGDDWYRWSSSW